MGTTTGQPDQATALTPGSGDVVKAADVGSIDAPFLIDKKGYDPLHRPFHRVNFVGYDRAADDETDPKKRDFVMSKKPANGKGYDCGCRSTEDFTASALFNAMIDGIFNGLKGALNSAVPGSQQALDQLEAEMKRLTGRDFEEEFKRFLANIIEGALFRSFLVHIPAWVPVNP